MPYEDRGLMAESKLVHSLVLKRIKSIKDVDHKNPDLDQSLRPEKCNQSSCFGLLQSKTEKLTNSGGKQATSAHQGDNVVQALLLLNLSL